MFDHNNEYEIISFVSITAQYFKYINYNHKVRASTPLLH